MPHQWKQFSVKKGVCTSQLPVWSLVMDGGGGWGWCHGTKWYWSLPADTGHWDCCKAIRLREYSQHGNLGEKQLGQKWAFFLIADVLYNCHFCTRTMKTWCHLLWIFSWTLGKYFFSVLSFLNIFQDIFSFFHFFFVIAKIEIMLPIICLGCKNLNAKSCLIA